MTNRITVARGDGIGPEIVDATLAILDATKAPLTYDFAEVGEAVYRRGIISGIPDSAWDLVTKNPVMLKGPITTPLGGGFKSINVTLRAALGLFANVRPCRSYQPYVVAARPMDLVIIRENEEGLYTGIEHQQTDEVVQVLKFVSRPGCERIIRYAFEYARAYGRKRVSCMTKDNIMKQSDGLFHRVFTEIAREYPDLGADHHIVDIGAARIAAQPERFDVIVTLNLYGDIVSDIAAQVAGSVGLAGSANIGGNHAMFEAVHGSAPDIAGQGIANPSGILNAAVLMLVHLGHASIAARVKNAWLKTLEDGIHTADIFRPATSKRQVSTSEFAQAVIERLGELPQTLNSVSFSPKTIAIAPPAIVKSEKRFVGVDVFLHWDRGTRDPGTLAAEIESFELGNFSLQFISNRGLKVYPTLRPDGFCTDHWRCRMMLEGQTLGTEWTHELLGLLAQFYEHGLEVIKTENLYEFSGQPGYSTGEGA